MMPTGGSLPGKPDIPGPRRARRGRSPEVSFSRFHGEAQGIAAPADTNAPRRLRTPPSPVPGPTDIPGHVGRPRLSLADFVCYTALFLVVMRLLGDGNHTKSRLGRVAERCRALGRADISPVAPHTTPAGARGAVPAAPRNVLDVTSSTLECAGCDIEPLESLAGGLAIGQELESLASMVASWATILGAAASRRSSTCAKSSESPPYGSGMSISPRPPTSL
jgi:hypothetical protein